MHLSVVAPFFNEEKNVAPFYDHLVTALEALDCACEMIFVDDGSTDGTYMELKKVARRDHKVKIIQFRRNFGQTPAMVAGIEHAAGDVIVTLDSDLQNDPNDIPEMLKQIGEGYDLVVGWRYNRKDKALTRRLPSTIANWLISKITRVPIKDSGCSLKVYRASVIKNVPLYSEMHRFIPAMASITGARIGEIKVRHHPRRLGESKYGLSRIYKVLLDVLAVKTIISFASRPLLWFALLAVPPVIAAFAMLIFSGYDLLANGNGLSLPIAGTAVLMAALAIIMFFTGILGELVYKTGNLRFGQLAVLTAMRVPLDSEPVARCISTDEND